MSRAGGQQDSIHVESETRYSPLLCAARSKPTMREHDRQVLAADHAERLRRYDEATQPDDTHLDAQARAACTLCDPDGYRPNGRVCDHIDRTKTAAAGSAKARAALSNIGRRNSTTDVALTEGEPE